MKHAQFTFLRFLICIGCILTLPLAVQTAAAKNAPVDEEEKDDGCGGKKPVGPNNESLGYYIDFGGIPFVSELGGAQIALHKLKPTPQMHTPQGLYYSSPAASSIMSVHGTDVLVRQSSGKRYTYAFSSGKSTATPENQPRSRQRLERLDASRQPITSGTPAYYIEHYSSGDSLVFDATSYAALEYRLASGLVVDFADSSLDVIYDAVDLIGTDSILRQIKSFEGLADIVTTTEDPSIPAETYEIRLYDVANSGTKVGGVYVPTGNPYKIFTIGNPDPVGNPGDLNRIRITEVHGARSIETNFRYDSGSEQWSMDTANGLKRIDKYVYDDPQTEERYFVRAMLDADANVVSKTYNVTKDFAWGNEIIRSVDDPDGFALTTYTEYFTSGNGQGHPKSERYADGSWATYNYDEFGRLLATVSPYMDCPFGAEPVLAQEMVYDYTPHTTNDTVLESDSRPRTKTSMILGVATERTFYAHEQVGDVYSEIEERAKSQSAAFGDAGNLRTTTTYYDASLGTIAAGRIHTVAVQAIGDTESSLETYSYAYDTGSDEARYTETVVYGTVASPAGVANKTMKVEKVFTFQGLLKTEKTYLNTGGTSYALLTTLTHGYDALRKRTSTVKDGRTLYAANYVDGVLDWQEDEAGARTSYTFDALDRILTMTQEGATENSDFADQSAIVTIYDRELGAITCGCDGIVFTTRQSGNLSLTSKIQKDEVGRMSNVTDEASLVTAYSYEASGRITNTYLPNTRTRIEENYLDGSPKSLTGTGAIHQFHDKGVNTDGSRWERTFTGTLYGPRYRKVTYDFLGRVLREESPAYGSDDAYTVELVYTPRGLLAKHTEPSKNPTLFEYDAIGQLTRYGLDVNADDALTLASTDRITGYTVAYESHDSAWWKVSERIVYPVDNTDAAVLASETRHRVSGFTATLASESRSFDVDRNQSSRTTLIDLIKKTVTNSVQTAQSTIPAVSVAYNGRLVQSNSSTVAAATEFSYDALGRRAGVKDPRHQGAVATTVYDPATGQVQSQSDAAGHATTYTYYSDQQLGAGQIKSRKNALNKFAYYAYDALGRKTQTWGASEYPTEYSYDSIYGELTSLKTWRDKSDAINFATAIWPAPSSSSDDETTWSYDPATALLVRKEYADGKGTEYTYTKANQLYTRTWERGITTTYSYAPTTGDQTGMDYSDDTADISYSNHDRLGRPHTITDATGTRTMAYDNASLRQSKETFDTTYFDGRILTRRYEDSSDTNGIVGRLEGYQLGISGALDVDGLVDYDYTVEGRLHTVEQGGDTFTYDYVTNSDLIQSLTAPVHTTTYGYAESRDLITNVANTETVGAETLVSNYAYRYNAVGLRTDVVNTGSAFAQAELSKWSYNDRFEINLQQRYLGTDPEAPGTNQPEEDFAYTYDKLGNRITSQNGTDSERSYSINNKLNQYSSIINPSASPKHDEDGNMTETGTGWLYQWSGENRMIEADNYDRDLSAETLDLPDEDGELWLSFTYDYMGRRVEKHVREYKVDTLVETKTRFIYNGWNLIGEYNSQPSGLSLQTSYTWGTDLSGNFQGAGGVGGLLKASNSQLQTSNFYLYDANGNVGQLLNDAGVNVAHYEYDPFGNLTFMSGALALENMFRFSTKYQDSESGLLYYGYRYYDPGTGRWPSRDPLEEWGGLNLYAMAINNPVNYWDYLGLKGTKRVFWLGVEYYRGGHFTLGASINFVSNFGKLGNAIMRAISYYEKYEIIVALGGSLTRTDRKYIDVPECYILKDRDGIKKAGVTTWDWHFGGPRKKLKPGEPMTGTPGVDIVTVTLNYWRSLELEWIPDPKDECCK